MDDVVNRFARELADAIAAAVAENPQVEACREKARAAGFEMKVTLEAVVGFVSRSQSSALTKVTAPVRPGERPPVPPLAANCGGRDGGGSGQLGTGTRDWGLGILGPAFEPAFFIFARSGSPPWLPPRRRPPGRRGNSGESAADRRPARTPAECRSGCSVPRSRARIRGRDT